MTSTPHPITAKTGWTEDYIRWELPLARGYAYYHTARIMEGEHTQWPGHSAAAEDWFTSIRQWAAAAH